MRSLLTVLIMFIGLFCYAQPSNDDCSNAVTLTSGGGCINGDNTNATTETLSSGPGNCFNGNPSNYSASVWYSFVATNDSMTINFGGGTLSGQTLASLYSGCTGTGYIACANNGSDLVTTSLIPGNTYYIMVDGAGNNEGTFCISVYDTPPPPPALGECENPRLLYVGSDCDNIQGTQYDEANNFIQGGNQDDGLPTTGVSTIDAGCGGNDIGQNSYWVEFNSVNNTSLTFGNNSGSSIDYALFTGDCSSLTSVSCHTAGGGGSVNVPVTPNTDYLVMITGAGGTNITQAYLCITGSNKYVPSNDDCPDATQINTATNYVLNNSNATVDANNTLCSGSTENNVWVYWVADFDGTAYVNLQNQDCINPQGMQMSIFEASNSCPNTQSNCLLYINPNNNDDFFGSFTASSGSTYYIQLDGYAGTACSFDFCITDFNNPDCATIIPLPVELSSFTGEFKERRIRLDWSTSSEANSDYYSVERSTDGKNWEVVSEVNASGFSTTPEHYYTYDNKVPSNSVIYYKLRQLDFDGHSKVYGPISVDLMEIEKTVVRRINLMGIEVDENYKGVLIIVYDDGTTIKTNSQ